MCIYRAAWEDAVKRAEKAAYGTDERRLIHREVMYTYAQWFYHSAEPEAAALREKS